MRGLLLLVVVLAASGCGRASPDPVPVPVPSPSPSSPPPSPYVSPDLSSCTRLPFAATLPIAEASGAVWLPRDGGVIVVIADSGHDGDYLIIDDEDGQVLERGKLPLGGRGDDLEGLAADGDDLWAITSSGWMRSWVHRPGGGFSAKVTAYALEDDGECPIDAVNCGHNYEGLCLAAAPLADGCRGYAVAKADGDLVCLVAAGDRWQVDRARTFHVTHGDVMAACDITADGAVWTGDNLFGTTTVRRLVGGKVAASGRLGDGFPEAMAIAPDGTIYRFSDMGGAPSRVGKYRCAAGPKAATATGANPASVQP